MPAGGRAEPRTCLSAGIRRETGRSWRCLISASIKPTGPWPAPGSALAGAWRALATPGDRQIAQLAHSARSASRAIRFFMAAASRPR